MNDQLIDLLGQADQALAAQDLDLAESLLSVIADAMPQSPDALARLGLIRLRQGRAADAEALLGRAIKTAPEAASLYFHLGLAQMEASDEGAVSRALLSFSHAIALDPASTSAYHAAGSKVLVQKPGAAAPKAGWGHMAMYLLKRAHYLAPFQDDIVHAFDMGVLAASRRIEQISDDQMQVAQLRAEVGAAVLSRKLKITLIDPMDWDYDVGSPDVKPLGGSQSAMCYLARALARRGHMVSTITGTRNPTSVHKVDCRRHADGVPRGEYAPDVAIILNSPSTGPAVRAQLPPGRPLLLWTQHAHDQSAMRALEDDRVLRTFSGIVCVSNWHRMATAARYDLGGMPQYVMRNGIGPRFDALALDPASLKVKKAGPPVLIYSSTPFRGLDLLLDAFPIIHAAYPDAQLQIFSSLQVYHAVGEDPYADLYARARAMPGVDYRGSVGQADLARALSAAHILAYPNTFPETSCITVMEGLASGLDVVTSHLAALPETGLGRARLIDFPEGPPDRGQMVGDFAAQVMTSLAERLAQPSQWLAARLESAKLIQAAANWDKRAAEWEMIFTTL